jgi:heme/copper-type cytochrome/quinol oxidase subunit 3
MRKANRTERNERNNSLHAAQELAEQYSHAGELQSEPRYRFLIAALMSFAILIIGLASTGCTVGQTRFMLGASLAADGATTQSALSSGSGTEGNPVMQKATLPVMLVLSGVVSLVAEKYVRNGETKKAKTLYTVASVIHGAAAAWNGFQSGKGGSSGGAVAARPLTVAGPVNPGGRPGIRLGF